MAEQLAFEEGLGQRRAVHLDERLVGAGRVEVDRARHELLPRPALAEQEDGAPGPRHMLDRPVDILHFLVASDDPVEAGPLLEGALELPVLVGQALLLGGDQAVEAKGLPDVLGDDLEEAEVFLHARLRLGRAVGRENPDDLSLDAHGNGDESHGSIVREPRYVPVRPRKRGSFRTSRATYGMPVFITWPTTPSPILYLPRDFSSSDRPCASSIASSCVSGS